MLAALGYWTILKQRASKLTSFNALFLDVRERERGGRRRSKEEEGGADFSNFTIIQALRQFCKWRTLGFLINLIDLAISQITASWGLSMG